MGVCYSVDENTRRIETKLAQEERIENETKKILFLGPGGSGKSTIFKQLQWLHLDGFSSRDALNLRRHIFSQTITQMLALIRYYEIEEERIYDDAALKDAIDTVKTEALNQHVNQALDSRLADAIKYIWKNDPQIRNAFGDENVMKYQILDETTEHFWDNIDRIKERNYIPNDRDILCVRCRTTGVADKAFLLNGTRFHIFDVGGQKSERRKWIYLFSEVKAVLFVISLASYNKMMYQDSSKNCMVDSLELFDEIVNDKHFVDTHIILFLNKKDIFKKKIKKIPITVCPAFTDFHDFNAGSSSRRPNPKSYHQTTDYVRKKFHALNKTKDKQIYSHLTYAMDRKNIDRVFLDVHQIIISANLQSEAGIH